LHRRRPGGPVFRAADEKAEPGPPDHGGGAQSPYDTFGWGVVFSDQTLGNLRRRMRRPRSHPGVVQPLGRYRCVFQGREGDSGGHGFCGIGRKHLLNILQQRCEELGVKLVFETELTTMHQYGADLVIASTA
jgi:anthraniloyl-CoA monooxygenase